MKTLKIDLRKLAAQYGLDALDSVDVCIDDTMWLGEIKTSKHLTLELTGRTAGEGDNA